MIKQRDQEIEAKNLEIIALEKRCKEQEKEIRGLYEDKAYFAKVLQEQRWNVTQSVGGRGHQ
jgi:uncharacterized protein (DUF3084 family)